MSLQPDGVNQTGRIYSLSYQRSDTSDCKDMSIRKLEFEESDQFLFINKMYTYKELYKLASSFFS